MVKQIKKFRTEFNVLIFMNVESLAHGKVNVVKAWSAKVVPANIAKRILSWKRIGGRIEPTAYGRVAN